MDLLNTRIKRTLKKPYVTSMVPRFWVRESQLNGLRAQRELIPILVSGVARRATGRATVNSPLQIAEEAMAVTVNVGVMAAAGAMVVTGIAVAMVVTVIAVAMVVTVLVGVLALLQGDMDVLVRDLPGIGDAPGARHPDPRPETGTQGGQLSERDRAQGPSLLSGREKGTARTVKDPCLVPLLQNPKKGKLLVLVRLLLRKRTGQEPLSPTETDLPRQTEKTVRVLLLRTEINKALNSL